MMCADLFAIFTRHACDVLTLTVDLDHVKEYVVHSLCVPGKQRFLLNKTHICVPNSACEFFDLER